MWLYQRGLPSILRDQAACVKAALHLARTTRLLLTAALLLAALGLSLARLWLLPEVDAYRQSLQATLSQHLGQPLRIAGLSAHMRGFYPELVLSDVAVVDHSGAIRVWLGQIHVGLDLPRGLFRGDWRSDWITLHGSELALVRRGNGEIELEGLQTGAAGMPPWLFGYGRFELQNCRVRWRDESRDGAGLEFSRVDLAIANRGRHHHIALDLARREREAGRLRLIADLKGDMEQPEQLAGRIFLQGWGVQPQAWPLPEAAGYAWRSGTADWRLWADWRDGALQQLGGWLALAEPRLVRHDDALGEIPFGLARLESQFRWQGNAQGWLLQTLQTRLNLDGRPWPESRFSLAYQNGTLQAAADYVRLDELNALAQTLALPELAAWRDAGLRGELRGLSLAATPDAPAGQPRYGLCGDFQGLGLNARQDWPGLSGLSGRLCGNELAAHIDLAAGPGEIALTPLFRAPQAYQQIRGPLDWQRHGESWAVASSGLYLETPYGALHNRFRLSQAAGAASPFLDWQADIQSGDMRGVPHYLPAQIMPADAVAWLDAAFLSGRFVGGQARLQGPLAAYPFNGGEGQFVVDVDVADAELRFAQGWQALAGLSGHLHFEGDGLAVRGAQGRLGETQVSDLAVVIDHMAPDGYLSLAGRVEGSLPQVLDYFAQTPKSGIVSALRDYTDMAGHADIDLLLGYDFSADAANAVQTRGEVRLANGRVRLLDSGAPGGPAAPRTPDLSIDGLAGRVSFENSRLSSDTLHAHLLGAPATFKLEGDGHRLKLHGEGQAGIAKLAAWQPAPAWEHIQGEAGYRLELDLPQDLAADGAAPALSLFADLADTAIDLPPPLGKAAALPATLRLNFNKDAAGLGLQADYNGLAKLQARLGRDSEGRWHSDSGELALGETALTAPAPGWRISGRLGAVPLDAWWKLWNGQPSATAYGNQLRRIDLSLAQPSWEGQTWGAVAVNLQHDADGWSGTLDSPFAAGSLRWPANLAQAPISLDLQRINLPAQSTWQTLARSAQTRLAPLDPATVPPLVLHSKQVLRQNHDLGRLDCSLARLPAGLSLKPCTLNADGLQTELDGEWLRNGGKDSSRLNGKIKAKDLGQLLEHLGFGDEVAETPAKVKFALNWPDAPQHVAAAKLNGEVAVQLNQGRLRHVDPGVGRALGLFNIETLKRRLLLDFSDVFDEGLAYDSVRGEFAISNGVATTRNLLIDGPSARIFVSGEADLANRTLNQLITVIPRTSLAWPIFGTLAGGPAVGAAVLLAQQLVGEKLEGITASQYAARGGWDDPTVVLLSRNTPLDVLLRAWQNVKSLSGFAEPEESKE